MGVNFRAECAANPELAKAYNGLNRKQAAEFRMNWLKKSCQTFKHERVESKRWRRIVITKGEYLTASQLIMTDGGWQDNMAVAGAARLMKHNLAMGEPWVKQTIHKP